MNVVFFDSKLSIVFLRVGIKVFVFTQSKWGINEAIKDAKRTPVDKRGVLWLCSPAAFKL